ncbi:hypothetical protein QO179_24060 [Bacillus stercoris]|nr:hypothetical protein [Bacillus stercoris]
MSCIKPEVEYLITYNGFTKSFLMGVDIVRGMRCQCNTDANGGIEPVKFLNYPGTGSEFSSIDVDIISDEVLNSLDTRYKAQFLVLLPDVNEYAICQYYKEYEMETWYEDIFILHFVPRNYS